MHPKEFTLRAYLDGELPEVKSRQIGEHLQSCSKCQIRLEEIRTRTQKVGAFLHDMLSESPAQPLSKKEILALFYTRENEMKPLSNFRKLRPLWITCAITIVLVITFILQPARAFASELLSLFRVKQLSTVQIDPASVEQFTRNSTFMETMGQVFSDSITITREKEDPQTGLDVETAKAAAGFPVRFPKDQDPVKLTLDTGIAFEIQMDAKQVEDVLVSAGKDDLELPEALKDANIAVNIPASVTMIFGECTESPYSDPDEEPTYRGSGDCLLLMQIPSPTIQMPADLDPVRVAEFGLEFLGMNPADASQLSQSIDWKTTLVIPIPIGKAINEVVEVDGVQGVLVRTSDQENSSGEFTLIWLQNDLIYAVFGYGDPALAIDLANSLE